MFRESEKSLKEVPKSSFFHIAFMSSKRDKIVVNNLFSCINKKKKEQILSLETYSNVFMIMRKNK
jgi:hypothetical protein